MGFALADLPHEAFENFGALNSVRHFRMKLNRIEAPAFIGHRRQRNCRRVADADETLRQLRHAVAMTHPHVEQWPVLCVAVIAKSVQKTTGASDRDLRVAEFAMRGWTHLSA